MVDIKSMLEKRLTSGILFYVSAKAVDYIVPYTRKYLKEHAEFGVGVGVPLVLEATGMLEKTGIGYDYIDAIMDGMSDYGFMKELRYIVDKELVAYATDANTIKVKNAEDLANAEIFIDGTKLAKNTDYTVTDNETISLANPLASGEHDIVIVDGTGKKSFHGKIRI